MGVWIETCFNVAETSSLFVTPFVGVWIETLSEKEHRQKRQSHPSWVCGLKQTNRNSSLISILSHPSWVCGLKPHKQEVHKLLYFVTPFVGVWIETDVFVCDGYRICVTPFVGVWIETLLYPIFVNQWSGHTLRGCVD